MSKKEEKSQDLLEAVCCNDAEMYHLLTRHLYIDPTVSTLKSDLGTLTEQAEKSINEGNNREAMDKYQLALDKALFDVTQNPGEKDRYVELIKDLASKTTNVTKKLKEELEKEGLVEYASSLEGRIKDYRIISDRIDDVIKTASLYYNERLKELKAGEMKEAREKERYEAAREEEKEREAAKARQEERKKMGRDERREAEKKDKREEEREKEKREARQKERETTQTEEDKKQLEEDEKRGARRKERREPRAT